MFIDVFVHVLTISLSFFAYRIAIFFKKAANKSDAYENGAIEIIIESIRNNIYDVRLCKAGCEALLRLISNCKLNKQQCFLNKLILLLLL